MNALSNSTAGARRVWSTLKAVLLFLPSITLAFVLFLASQSLGTQYNLYYLLWKAGIRRYEPQVALSGIFHDHAYREHFVGMTQAEFEKHFPSTFHRVRRQPPIAAPGEAFYIDDYSQSIREDGRFDMCWFVVVRENKVVKFSLAKG